MPPGSTWRIWSAGTQFTGLVLTTPKILTAANDTNGNPLIVPTATASAVNGIGLTNAATGNAPLLTVAGASADANAGLNLSSKGTGSLLLMTGAGARTVATFVNVAASVDGLTVTPAATANPATVDLAGTGSDTNINLSLTPKGAGAVKSAASVQALSGTATTAGGAVLPALAMGTGLFGIYFGSGAPSITAPQGSLYIRSDGSSTATRLYVNTTGSTVWTPVTTAA